MKYTYLLCVCMLLTGISATSVSAAVLKLDTEVSTLHVGDVFDVELIVDTQNQTLNAVATEIIFPSDILEFVASDDGDSIINLWIKRPSLSETKAIPLAGITPGGFIGLHVPVITLTFKVIAHGQGIVESQNAELLLHDGLGSKSSSTLENLHISVVKGESTILTHTVDDEMPEHFMPILTSDPDVFDGVSVLIFATEDKGSGIAEYKIKEGFFGYYKKAESPYVVLHQKLDTKISVKAIDRSGNERVEILYPQNWKPWHLRSAIPVTIIVLCIFTLFILTSYRRRLSQK